MFAINSMDKRYQNTMMSYGKNNANSQNEKVPNSSTQTPMKEFGFKISNNVKRYSTKLDETNSNDETISV